MIRRVVCAANRYGPHIFLGARHFDARMHEAMYGMRAILKQYIEEEGFVDQRGVFMSREEAWIVAEAAGQIIRRVGGDGAKLFSENLY